MKRRSLTVAAVAALMALAGCEISQVTAPRDGAIIDAPTTTVTINLNGNMQSVNTDAAGARVLQDILSQLGNAKATSSTR